VATTDDPYALALHAAFDEVEPRFHEALSQSLDPQGPDALFDVVAAFGLSAGAVAVDVGCGRGRQSLELARRFGFDVLGIDRVVRHEEAERTAAEAGTGAGSVRFATGTAEAIPVADASVDLVFCRDSIMFADLDAAAVEFRRVLRPGGRGLVYLVLDGPLMTADESEQFAALMRGRSLRPADIEAPLERAGLELTERLDLGGEWGERTQELEGTAGERLLFASRLLRRPERYLAEFGRDNYDIMLGDCLWHVYRLIGKLSGYACTFVRP
jgi:SAM-dependent methyltransferase